MLSTTDSKSNIFSVMQACNNVYADYPVVAKLAIAQAILESHLEGTPSGLALRANNLFGIKGSGTDGSINMPTHEFENGQWIIVDAYFAKNLTIQDSIMQHRNLMLNGTSGCPNRYKPVLQAKSFEEAANQIRLCGYATDPSYTQKLIDIYNRDINA